MKPAIVKKQKLPDKRKKKLPGVSQELLLNNTPNLQTELSQYVKVLRKTASLTSFGVPELFYITKSKEPTTSAKPPHLRTVIRWFPGTEDNLWVSCSCEWFMFNCEYALWTHNASSIIYSNGEPALITNPRNIPMCCLTGDTLIRTPKGQTRLSDIKEGDKVNTIHGNRLVLAHVSTGKKEVFKVTTERGHVLKGSKDHKILVLRNNLDFDWVEIKDLKVGDNIVSFINKDTRKGKFSKKDKYLSKLLGYMISDGWNIYFCQNDGFVKDDFVKLFRKVFKTNTKITKSNVHIGRNAAKVFKSLGGFGNNSYEHSIPEYIWKSPKPIIRSFLQGLYEGDGHTNKENNTITYATVSHKLATELQELLASIDIRTSISINISGVNNSKIWLIRSSDYKSSKNLLKILKGTTKYRKLSKPQKSSHSIIESFPSTSKQIVDKYVNEVYEKIKGTEILPIREIMKQFNIPTYDENFTQIVNSLETVHSIPNGKYKPYKGTTINEMKLFPKFKNYLKLSLFKRPSEITNVKSSINNSLKFPLNELDKNHWLRLILRKDMIFETIESIENDGEEEMFDIEVDKDNMFIANGIVVHNCKHIYAVLTRKKALEKLKKLYKTKGRK